MTNSQKFHSIPANSKDERDELIRSMTIRFGIVAVQDVLARLAEGRIEAEELAYQAAHPCTCIACVRVPKQPKPVCVKCGQDMWLDTQFNNRYCCECGHKSYIEDFEPNEV